MKKLILLLSLAAAVALVAAGCSDERAHPTAGVADKAAGPLAPDDGSRNAGVVVVANRGSGSISVIDARAATLLGTYPLPQDDGEPTPEPMYVSHSARANTVLVGDRANDRVVAFDAVTFDVVGTAAAGQGVFHQWANPDGQQLWVNNDIDNTISIIDPVSLDLIHTVDIPADLVAMGGKPHDVVLDHRGRWAYVTLVGVAGDFDYLLQYDTTTFTELNRQPVGGDPHVSIGVNTNLYVPCQVSGEVLVYDPETLALVDQIEVPGAHGAAMAGDGRHFFCTNVPGGGDGAIYTIGTRRNQVAGSPTDSPYPVPHNLSATPDGKLLFVTHSGGSSDKVTVYQLVGPYRQAEYQTELTVGLNPFGIGYAYPEDTIGRGARQVGSR
jgi:DNA-binding beta-propeller fold protein YncE